MPREYISAEAFRRALEARLNKAAQAELVQVNRLRRQVAFDRLLARLFRTDSAPWVLKGGYALELRFKTARATVDIDLTVQRIAVTTGVDANQILRSLIQNAASSSLGDWFEYTIGPQCWIWTPRLTVERGFLLKREWMAGSSRAFISPPASATRSFNRWKSLRAATGWTSQVSVLHGSRLFRESSSLPRNSMPIRTLLRSSTNSRVKDLVDLALLIGSGGLSPTRIEKAVQRTFAHRRTHELPSTLPKPPRNWQQRFVTLAEECQLTGDMDTVFKGVAEFSKRLINSGETRG